MARELLSAKGLEERYKQAAAEADRKNTRVRVSDGNNLQLVVRPGGGASWQLLARVDGKRKPITLGPWPDVTLKKARALADVVRDKVRDGIDPIAHKRKAKIEAKQKAALGEITVKAMYSAWLDKMQASSGYVVNIQNAFVKDVLPAIGSRHPADVTRQDVINVLRKLERRGALDMLRRVRRWMRQMYEFGLDDGRFGLTSSPVPTGHLKSFLAHEKGHFAALTNAEEIGPLMAKIMGYEHTVVRTLLLLSAHLFQRPKEMRMARWEQFDFEEARWVIPEHVMKKRREHWVPLSPQVVKILRDHQGVVGNEGWLFPGRRYDQPVSEGRANKALQILGYSGFHTSHGFRAMANTIMAEGLEVDERYIDKQLSHQQKNKVKAAYNRAEFWQARVKMMCDWSDWLDAQLLAQQSTQ